MKHNLLSTIAIFLLLSLPFTAQSESTDNSLPDFTLTVPQSETDRQYLGLKKEPGETFSIKEIDADILLIELFSMYCPFCQEEAPAVNILFQAMQDYSESGVSVKIIGLGANNSEFEVDHFRTTYDVKFPLFADKDMSMYDALGGKGTPGFVGCKKGQDDSFTIVLKQSGGFHHPDEFLLELLKKSGYKE
ncbi:peroxiredoxin [Desulfopila sp. IMCC35008]|uniref:peroxiredoxin family protein n=1 Tax=Desulfopila sp. IMCC35008 TaxID=2653858 RepID=UPI0013D222E6|nr:redoxin domain-containing protein [Desulfopila sp. IMCC35008]